MKYAIILPDGAADEPCSELGGKTPLQAARLPAMDEIARIGRVGTVVTVPAGFTPGSEVATMSLFGYDPRTDFPGRAPLEAAARGIAVDAEELIFRCNFVTIHNESMVDFTAEHIRQAEADTLIAHLNKALREMGCRFHSGVSYRNLMVLSDTKDIQLKTTAPHDIPGKDVSEFLPTGSGAARVQAVMENARYLLKEHPINLLRVRRDERPASDIWLWGQGRPGQLEPFADRFGIKGAAIAAVDLIRGIARLAGLTVLDVAGATGYLDTDYAAKGRAAVRALDKFDLVIVHIEAPDEAGHLGDVAAKVTALERIDELIVAPLLSSLRSRGEWRLLIAPDHPTPVGKRVHTNAPPPFCMAGSNIHPAAGFSYFDEDSARCGLQIQPGCEIMNYFLTG